jgi:hypothetical protein
VILVPYVALFCGVAAAVLVLPLMAAWPRLRQPDYPVAAIWGGLSGGAAAVLMNKFASWYAVLAFGVTGLASGLLYAHLARKRSTDL